MADLTGIPGRIYQTAVNYAHGSTAPKKTFAGSSKEPKAYCMSNFPAPIFPANNLSGDKTRHIIANAFQLGILTTVALPFTLSYALTSVAIKAWHKHQHSKAAASMQKQASIDETKHQPTTEQLRILGDIIKEKKLEDKLGATYGTVLRHGVGFEPNDIRQAIKAATRVINEHKKQNELPSLVEKTKANTSAPLRSENTSRTIINLLNDLEDFKPAEVSHNNDINDPMFAFDMDDLNLTLPIKPNGSDSNTAISEKDRGRVAPKVSDYKGIDEKVLKEHLENLDTGYTDEYLNLLKPDAKIITAEDVAFADYSKKKIVDISAKEADSEHLKLDQLKIKKDNVLANGTDQEKVLVGNEFAAAEEKYQKAADAAKYMELHFGLKV